VGDNSAVTVDDFSTAKTTNAAFLESTALKDRVLSVMQKNKLSAFIDEIELAIPASFRNSFKNKVQVVFKKLDKTSKLVLPLCPGESKTFSERVIYGLNNPFGVNQRKIWINQHFLDTILDGEERAATYRCGHKNSYKLAKAAVIHELAHQFDYDGKILGVFKSKISSKKRFKYLNNFNKSFSTLQIWKKKNKNHIRDLSSTESDGLREAFAVNMEYFLLDKDYKCRRPSYYNFFSSEFNHIPFKEYNCESGTTIFLKDDPLLDRKNLVDLDPSRIYQIHYVVAGKGRTIGSRWGHSMFKFVICSPKRVDIGPDCLKDVQYHVIANYRASITDITVSNFKGIIGKYPSRLFFQTFISLLREYNSVEFRDVISVPFNFSRSDIDLFTSRILEQYWQYQGKYYFFSNNCGHESNQFVKAISDDHQILDSKKFFPLKILEYWGQIGFTDNSVLNDEKYAIENGFLFKSSLDIYEKAFQAIGPNLEDVYTYITKSTALERRELYLRGKAEVKSHQQKIILVSSFLKLENKFYHSLQANSWKKLATMYVKKEKYPHVADIIDPVKDQIVGFFTKHISSFLNTGYGIPLKKENDELIDSLIKKQSNLQKINVFSFIRDNFSAELAEEFKELDLTNENIQLFMRGYLNPEG
jgi:hypothetical protein